jgi:hypothetical protein
MNMLINNDLSIISIMGFRLPKLSMNSDWLVLGGTVALAVYTAVLLHNQYGSVVPTIPGLSYGSGGPATGFYTGNKAPYTAEPLLQQAYGDVRPYTQPIGSAIQGGARTIAADIEGLTSPVQAMWGAWYGQGGVGRGSSRDAWTDVYDPSKGSASITGDDPTHRLSIA